MDIKKEPTEITITLNRAEVVYLNAISNLALKVDSLTGGTLEDSIKAHGFSDINYAGLIDGFEEKISDVTHKYGWCPDPDCADKK